MADETPKKSAFGMGWLWQGRPCDATNGINGRVYRHGKISSADTDSHLDRQMPIRAQGLDAEFTQVRAIWSAVGVDQREKQFCARVRGFLAKLPFVRAKHSRGAV